MPYRSQTLAIQEAVKQLGHDPGPLDGWFGSKTAAGVESWLEHAGEPKPMMVPAGALIGLRWHWTAGGHKASSVDREHYNFVIEADGTVIKGDHPPEDQISTADGVYAAHTGGNNTGNIGIGLCGMLNADDWPMDPGPYPITEAQVDELVRLSARLCAEYAIFVGRETTMSHAEVEPTLGIPQKGKWDIRWLPGMSTVGDAIEIGDKLRDRVLKQMEEGA